MHATAIPENDPQQAASQALENLEKELLEYKHALQNLLRNSPDNLPAHRVYLTYVGKVVEILKVRVQSQAQEPEKLLIDTLKIVVLTLMEHGETQAAELVGESLNDIGEKVKEQWLSSRGLNFPGDTAKFSSWSKPPSLPSPKPARRKKKIAGYGPKPT